MSKSRVGKKLGSQVIFAALTALASVLLPQDAFACRDLVVTSGIWASNKTSNYAYKVRERAGFRKCKVAKVVVTKVPDQRSKRSKCTRAFLINKRQIDGCSGGRQNKKWGKIFRAACNEHDACYRTLGVSKFECEAAFTNNLYVICKTAPFGCRAAVPGFLAAVGVGGHSSYANGQRWAAKNCK